LPYDEFDLHKVKLAMKIGGEYELLKIGLRQWHKLAQETRADAEEVIGSLRAMADELPTRQRATSKHRRRSRQSHYRPAPMRLIERGKESSGFDRR